MEYDYTQRKDFTSEIYKIQVRNINEKTSTNQFKKFLQGLGVNAKKVKITKPITFVTFADENERNKAIEKLKDQKFRNKSLDVKIAKPKADPCITAMKEKLDQPVSLEDFYESIRLSVAPLSKLDYEAQIDIKSKNVNEILSGFLKKLEFPIKKKYENFQLQEFICSPKVDEYRNKCEFSFGYGYEDSILTIGFKSGKYKDGATRVALTNDLKPVSQQYFSLVKDFEFFLRNDSLGIFQVFDHVNHTGNYKQIMIRSNSRGEKYVKFLIDPQELDETILIKFETHIKSWLDSFAEKHVIKQFQFSFKRFIDSNPIRETTIIGDDFILYEKCCNKIFKISPNSFFQVNLQAAELLYNRIGQIIAKIKSDKPKVLFDICSGTGTIGQCLEEYVDKVVGIEIVDEAVKDAEDSALKNGLKKCSYMCGRAEELIDLAVDINKKDFSIIAILDPPRCGLNSSVIKTIRKCEDIEHLFYVSCDLKAALPNLNTLMQNESRRCTGPSFTLESAQPFDFFPHTTHSEVLFKFKRQQAQD